MLGVEDESTCKAQKCSWDEKLEFALAEVLRYCIVDTFVHVLLDVCTCAESLHHEIVQTGKK